MRKLLLLTALALGFSNSHAQVIITPGGGAASIISAIGGAGLTLSNVVVTCTNTAYGTYSNAPAGGFGASMSNGLLLTTGSAAGVSAAGGNSNDDYSTCVGTSSTDPQLISVIGAGTDVNDACIIEFDVVPQCNNLQIRFVFGSDEYTNWVSAGFNDGFGFFVSGPNPAGGSYTNYNLARLPSGTLVSIDNVNTSSNPAFFVNNNSGTYANHFDGFTTVLNPTMNVTPCASYHFKLAIGDAGDCAMDSGVMIDLIQCTSPWTVATSSTPTGCGAASGTATATASGGIGPFTYSWAPTGGTGTTATALAAGSYTCTVNDGISCTPAQTYTVTVGTSGTPNTVTVPANNSYCKGATVPASAFVSTPAGGTFAWTNSNTAIGLGASGTGQQPSFTATNAGTTPITGTITVTPTVAGCAGTPNTYTITVNPTPSMTTPAAINVCAGTPIPASAFTGPVAGTTFGWTNSNTGIGLGASGTGNTGAFTATNATTSDIVSTITVTPTANGCPGTPVTYTITVKPTPNVTVPANATVCKGATIPASSFTSTVPGTTFPWTNSNTATGLGASGTGNTPSFTAANPGTTPITSTVTVTPTANGCPGTPVTYTITVNPTPSMTTPANINVCAGTAIPASAFTGPVAGTTFAWTNSNTAIGLGASGASNTPAFTATNATASPITSTVTVTPTASTCPGAPVTYTITVNPMPTVTVPPAAICPGGTATFTASGAASYTWSAGATSTGVNTATASPATTTSYTVTGTSAGCSSTALATVTVGSSMSITVNSPSVCAGQTAMLGASGAASYTWSAGTTPVGTDSASVSPATTTSYTVTGTTGACSGTGVATVTVNAIPTVTVNSIAICNGATAGLTAGGAASYTWSAGAASTGVATADASPTATTSYTVTGTTSGCSNTAVSTVTVNAIPTVTVNSPTICPSTTAGLTANGAASYTWSAGATSTGVNTADASPSVTTTYTVTGTTSGCSNTAVSTVTVAAALTVTVNSPTICAGQTAMLGANGAASYTWTAGATPVGTDSASATPVTTTTYTVTGITGGCSGTAVATVTVTPLPVVAVSSPTICNGITAHMGASGAASYTWSAGATPVGTDSATAAPSTTTSYTVTGTSSGCSGTAVSTVTVNPIPTTTVNSPSVCPGITAGLTANGAASYTWTAGATSTGVNTADASPASTTSYTVTGTSLGCSSTAVSTVTVAASMTITVNSPTICAGQTAMLGGSGAASYTWTAGATPVGTDSASAAPASTTTYTVTGTTGGCSGTAVATVTVTPLPVVAVNSPTICNGVTAHMGASGAASFVWSAGATPVGTDSATSAPSTTTSYTVTGTSSGCSSTAVSTVTVNPIPTTTVNSPSTCPGSTAGLTANGANSYTWSAGATSTGVNTADVTPPSTSTYTVTGTSLGCSSTAVSTVTINTVLSVDAGLNDSICFGGSSNLTVTPNGAGFNYTWTPSATLSSGSIFNPVASPAATTTYSVTVIDPNGCTGSDSVTIYADPQINLAVAGLPANCNGASDGQTIVIPNGGTSPYTYAWTGTSGCTLAACNQPAGTYTVTVTDGWGCTSTGTATVTEPTAVTATSTQVNVTCFASCNGTATATGAGGTPTAGGAYNYSWNTAPVQNTQTATGLCSGTYTCTVSDANGCSTTVTVTITEPTAVSITPIADITICNSASTTLTAAVTGGTGATYTYGWLATTGLSDATIANPVAAPATTTTYSLTVTDANGCTDHDTVTVTVNPPLSVATAGTASICPGAGTPITAVAANGSGSGYTYSWTPVTGLSDATIANPTATPVTTTTYTVVVGDGCSPTVTSTVTVTILPLPVPVITSNVTSGCAPVCVNFTDASTIPSGTVTGWSWNFGDVSSTAPGLGQTPTHCYTAGTYTVTLTDTSAAGCIATSTIPFVINVSPIPVAQASAPASTSIFTPTVNYTDQSFVSSGTITSWDWAFGDTYVNAANDSSSLQNPSHLFTEVGSYCGNLIVTTNAGCRDTTDICIVIDPEFTFFIPNAFSPNDDGINDEFYGKGEFIKKYEMYIYDRWGNMIFAADDINKHWDGRANNGSEVAQEDVYVYVVKLTDNHEKSHKYIGTVTIVK